MQDKICVNHCYGPLKPDIEYPVIQTGYDWIQIKYGGGAMYVPTVLIDRGERRRARRYEEEVDEDYLQTH